MSVLDRLLVVLLATLVVSLPFDLRDYPIISNLQWVFVAVSMVAVPIIFRERKRLMKDRLVLLALLFVISQWLAAALAPELNGNAIKAAVRVTSGFALLCITLCVPDLRIVLRTWAVSAIAAALYGILDYAGFGLPGLFREREYYFANALRLSGSF